MGLRIMVCCDLFISISVIDEVIVTLKEMTLLNASYDKHIIRQISERSDSVCRDIPAICWGWFWSESVRNTDHTEPCDIAASREAVRGHQHVGQGNPLTGRCSVFYFSFNWQPVFWSFLLPDICSFRHLTVSYGCEGRWHCHPLSPDSGLVQPEYRVFIILAFVVSCLLVFVVCCRLSHIMRIFFRRQLELRHSKVLTPCSYFIHSSIHPFGSFILHLNKISSSMSIFRVVSGFKPPTKLIRSCYKTLKRRKNAPKIYENPQNANIFSGPFLAGIIWCSNNQSINHLLFNWPVSLSKWPRLVTFEESKMYLPVPMTLLFWTL